MFCLFVLFCGPKFSKHWFPLLEAPEQKLGAPRLACGEGESRILWVLLREPSLSSSEVMDVTFKTRALPHTGQRTHEGCRLHLPPPMNI